MHFWVLFLTFCCATSTMADSVDVYISEHDDPATRYGIMRDGHFIDRWDSTEEKARKEEGIDSKALFAASRLVRRHQKIVEESNKSTHPHQVIDPLTAATQFFRDSIKITGKATKASDEKYIEIAVTKGHDLRRRYARDLADLTPLHFFMLDYGLVKEKNNGTVPETFALPDTQETHLRLQLSVMSWFSYKLFEGDLKSFSLKETAGRLRDMVGAAKTQPKEIDLAIKQVCAVLKTHAKFMGGVVEKLNAITDRLKKIYGAAGLPKDYFAIEEGNMKSGPRPLLLTANRRINTYQADIYTVFEGYDFNDYSKDKARDRLNDIIDGLSGFSSKLDEQWQNLLVLATLLRATDSIASKDNSEIIANQMLMSLSNAFSYRAAASDSTVESQDIISDTFLKYAAKFCRDFKPSDKEEQKKAREKDGEAEQDGRDMSIGSAGSSPMLTASPNMKAYSQNSSGSSTPLASSTADIMRTPDVFAAMTPLSIMVSSAPASPQTSVKKHAPTNISFGAGTSPVVTTPVSSASAVTTASLPMSAGEDDASVGGPLSAQSTTRRTKAGVNSGDERKKSTGGRTPSTSATASALSRIPLARPTSGSSARPGSGKNPASSSVGASTHRLSSTGSPANAAPTVAAKKPSGSQNKTSTAASTQRRTGSVGRGTAVKDRSQASRTGSRGGSRS